MASARDTAHEDVRRHIVYKRDGERALRPEIAGHMLAALDAGAAPDYAALLRDASWPTPPVPVFHTAPRTARDMIAATGLRTSQPGSAESGDPWPDPYGTYAAQPAGVYVGQGADLTGRWSRWAEWDVWEVDVTGLPWAPDELNVRCWVIPADIPADRVRLLT